MFKWTLASGDGTISDVEMYLYMYGVGDPSSGWSVEAHRMKRTDADPTYLNWYVYKSGTNWQTAGGVGANDYDSTVISSVAYHTDVKWDVWGLVGNSATNPLTLTWGDNAYIFLKENTQKSGSWYQYMAYASKEYTSDSSKRPYLEITYTPLPSTPPLAPTNLLTDGYTNPIGVTSTLYFSAIYRDPNVTDTAHAYQLQVSSSSTNWSSLVWDSGTTTMATTTQGSRCPDITYTGSALSMNGIYYWRIKFWDALGQEGAFSTSTASFTMATPITADAFDSIEPEGMVTSVTKSFTVGSGQYRGLYVGVRLSNIGLTPTVTWNGTALAEVGASRVADPYWNERLAWYHLEGEDTGSHNVVVSVTSSAYMKVYIHSYFGVNQAGQPDGASANSELTNTTDYSPTVSVSTPGSWVLAFQMGNCQDQTITSSNMSERNTLGYNHSWDSNGTVSVGTYTANFSTSPEGRKWFVSMIAVGN